MSVLCPPALTTEFSAGTGTGLHVVLPLLHTKSKSQPLASGTGMSADEARGLGERRGKEHRQGGVLSNSDTASAGQWKVGLKLNKRRQSMDLAHLEAVAQLTLEACICSPPSRRHAGLEGGSQFALLGAQLPHVVQICT